MIQINDDNWKMIVEETNDTPAYGTGLVKRDFRRHPLSNPFSKELTPLSRDRWSDIITEKKETGSRLSDIYAKGNFGDRIPSLDQKQSNFCWAYSSVGVVQCLRAIANLPYVELSPHAVACKLMDFRNVGGWGAMSMEFIMENGVPATQFWPSNSFSRQYDKSATWENAKLHRITEGWIDLDAWHPSAAKLTFDQSFTLALMGIPVVLDFDWWGHSVWGIDPLEFDSSLPLNDMNRWGWRIQNSWGDVWSVNGQGEIRGRKAIPMGGCAPRFAMAA